MDLGAHVKHLATYDASGAFAGFRRRSNRREELELELDLSRSQRGLAAAFVARYLVKLTEGV